MALTWAARHGMTSAEYQSEFTTRTGQGYRLTQISGYSVGDQARYAAIFEKTTGPAWAARHGMTSAEYQSEFTTRTGQGYRLTQISGYSVGDQARYAAIFEKTTGPAWAARHGMTSAEYQSEFTTRTGQGYRLTQISGYSVGDQARYAAIFEKTTGPAWAARHGMTSAEYQSEFTTRTGQGYRLTQISGYSVGDQARYAAIFEKTTGPAWAARHGMTSAEYQSEFDKYYYQCYKVKQIVGYSVSGKAYYAAIWESEAPIDSNLGLIDTKIQDYMKKHRIPGLSIAITKSERLVFAKGYGFADDATKEQVNPRHRFRIASISKPVTAIAVMELVETLDSGLINRNVFGPGAVLGTQYGTPPYSSAVRAITVRHLLQHTSGWSNTGGDPMFMNQLANLNQSELISWVLDNRQPINPPGTENEYLNFGYCVLGRVIEAVSGKSYETYVQEVLAKCGVKRMEIGGRTQAERKPDEVVYYGGSPYNLNPRRMDAHGGWIASPIDLVRFMARTDGFSSKVDILTAVNETDLWTGSPDNPGYGMGWIIGPDWRGHNGGMSGSLGFLVSRTDGFSFAVLANTRPSGDQFCFELKGVIDDFLGKVKFADCDHF